MKILTILLSVFFTTELFAQNGYIKLENDCLLVGYLRPYTSIIDGHHGLEVWKTKRDRNPSKIPKNSIIEYALRKDTFKVLHQYRPFHGSKTYFELVEAKLLSSGRVNLYIIANYQNAAKVSTYTGNAIIPLIIDASLENYSFIYLLEDNTGFLQALPSKREKLNLVLEDFFPKKHLSRFSELNGDITYRTIPKLVRSYNLGKDF